VTTAAIRVAVVDDHAVVREGIRRVFESEPGIAVVGEAGDGDGAIALVEHQHPDVLVIDVAMPGRTGLAVTAELTRRKSPTRVLVLSMHDESQYLREARRVGARGYLLKDAPPAELRRAVRSVHAGREVFPEALMSRLEASPATSRLEALTPREREVFQRIAHGDTNKEIAARLGISPRTVETHRESLMQKLAIRTVAGLTRLALEEGVLTIDDRR
jgi:DNA-binding NarL/FixJ family response regulator